MTIRNIVFDIGNVLTRWNPHLIVERALGKERATDEFVRSIFPGEDAWIPLNLGEITVDQAMHRYRDKLGLTQKEAEQLWFHVLDIQEPIAGSLDLVKQAKTADYGVYALSDNVHEIVEHLKANYEFWPLLDGAVISAEVGLLKPDPAIYRLLLDRFGLNADETIFMDDMPGNVEGAQFVGMKAFQFSTTEQARQSLRDHNVLLGQVRDV